jgi:DNA repair protein RadC
MAGDDRVAEHRWHWLLDVVCPGPRRRGEVFDVTDREVQALLDRLRADARDGRLRPRQAAHDLVRTLEDLLADRADAHRQAGARRYRRLAPRSVRDDDAPIPADAVELPLRLRDQALPPALPPRFLESFPEPPPRRPGRMWRDDARMRRASRTPPCRVRLLLPRNAIRSCPTPTNTEPDRMNAPLELDPERIAGLEIAVRLTPGVSPDERVRITSSAQVAAAFAHALGDAMDRERILIAPLDARDRLIGVHPVAIGSSTHCLVTLADVYRAVLLPSAARYFIAHNHPSGSISPSAFDLTLTRRLHAAGRDLGVELCDHLILGFNGAFHSLRAHGQGVPAWDRSRAFEPIATIFPPPWLPRIANTPNAR